MKEFLIKHSQLFAQTDYDLGHTTLVSHKINTGDSRPIKQPLRRIPVNTKDQIDETLEGMIEKGVIEPSTSPWASGVVLVKKKDGSTRFCVDYRRLNDVTVKDAYPLPRIDESLDHLAENKWFSTLDLRSGYWPVDVDPVDRPKTAFITKKGLWQFRVMPFGLQRSCHL